MQYVPTVYVKETALWEYQTIERKVSEPLSAEELNEQGGDGWELAAILPFPKLQIYYFKRLAG